MNNVNIGDQYDDGLCSGVIDWNEYQVALWYVIDGLVVGDSIHSYYNANNRQDCISQGLAKLAIDEGGEWTADCDKPGELVPLLFIVDKDTTGEIKRQVLMGEAKITDVKGMCKCKAAPTASPTIAPTASPTVTPTEPNTCVADGDQPQMPAKNLYEIALTGKENYPDCDDLGQNESFQGADLRNKKGECKRINICHGNAGFGWNRITVDRDALGVDNKGKNGHAKFEHNDPDKNKRADYFPGWYSVPTLMVLVKMDTWTASVTLFPDVPQMEVIHHQSFLLERERTPLILLSLETLLLPRNLLPLILRHLIHLMTEKVLPSHQVSKEILTLRPLPE
jgi:hypothetical protein